LVPYVSMIVSFLEMRIGWQDPSNSVVDLQDEMSFDLLALMERSIRGTCDLVATMSRAENNVAGVQSGLVGELSPIASTLVPPAPHFVATTLIADITAWVDNDDDGRRAMPPVFVDLITTTDLSRASAIVRLLYDSERHLLSEGELLLPMRMWHYMGKALHAGGRSVQISLARYSWQRCADVLDVTAGDLKLIQLRCESLAALCASACHPDSPLPDFGRLCVAKVNAEMIGEPLRPIAVSELAHIDDDLVDQLEYCFAAVDRLRAQSLQLHRVDGDDVLLRNEMTVTLCVALGKCRAVLEHAFTRFARSAIWAPMSKRPPPELTFQAKFPEGVDSTSFRADILRQLHCNHDVFDNANAAVWSALESVQGYACDEPWLSELCSLVNESKHERVHLVEHARLREWWTPARSVDDGFPLYVRDEHFFPWSFWRECGDAQISKALIACLSDEGILFPWRSLLRGKNRRSSLSSEQVADLATEFPTINVAPLVKRIGNAHFINADMISRCNKYFNEVSKSNTSRTVISRSGWVSAKVYGKLSSQEREVVVLRMREESRKCADRLVALGALSTGPAMVYSVPPSSICRSSWTQMRAAPPSSARLSTDSSSRAARAAAPQYGCVARKCVHQLHSNVLRYSCSSLPCRRSLGPVAPLDQARASRRSPGLSSCRESSQSPVRLVVIILFHLHHHLQPYLLRSTHHSRSRSSSSCTRARAVDASSPDSTSGGASSASLPLSLVAEFASLATILQCTHQTTQ
jgi:hypothetical protein